MVRVRIVAQQHLASVGSRSGQELSALTSENYCRWAHVPPTPSTSPSSDNSFNWNSYPANPHCDVQIVHRQPARPRLTRLSPDLSVVPSTTDERPATSNHCPVLFSRKKSHTKSPTEPKKIRTITIHNPLKPLFRVHMRPRPTSAQYKTEPRSHDSSLELFPREGDYCMFLNVLFNCNNLLP